MADNLGFTPGSGKLIATDEIDADSSHAQVMKLAYSADGVRTPVTADADGLEVQIGKSIDLTVKPLTGQVFPVNDNGGVLSVDDNSASLTVDAPVAVPVFVRLSDGASAVDALPVTDNGLALSVDDGGASLTVDGAVTATQGTPGSNANGWPVKVTDGSNTAGLTLVGATYAVKTDVVQSVLQQVDKTAFTEGAGLMTPVGGVLNDTISADPSQDQAAALRITAKRGLHVNLRNVAGTEIGTSADPVEVCLRNSSGTELGTSADPVEVGLRNAAGTEIGTAASPVHVALRDESAAAYSEANPVPVSVVRGEQVRVSKSVAITASQTGATVWDPDAGKKFVVTDVIIALSVGGDLTVFDGTDAEANRLSDGTMPVGYFHLPLARLWPSSTADNVLKYTSGTGITGKITVHGYEV